jgi:hypothetical protein
MLKGCAQSQDSTRQLRSRGSDTHSDTSKKIIIYAMICKLKELVANAGRIAQQPPRWSYDLSPLQRRLLMDHSQRDSKPVSMLSALHI